MVDRVQLRFRPFTLNLLKIGILSVRVVSHYVLFIRMVKVGINSAFGLVLPAKICITTWSPFVVICVILILSMLAHDVLMDVVS